MGIWSLLKVSLVPRLTALGTRLFSDDRERDKLKMAFLLGSLRRGAVAASWRRAGVLRWSSASVGQKGGIVKADGTEKSVEEVTPDELVPVSSFGGVPDEQLQRKARIYVPAQNAMQSGTNNTHHWRLEFDTQERWENPLMGWASSADPLSNLSVEFDSKAEAIAFAVRSGWDYEVEEPKRPKMRSKTYGENFSWDKKTRIVSK